MLQFIPIKKFSMLLLALFAVVTAFSQERRVQPVWWFGESGAANFNSYGGTTQILNSSLTTPTAFHKGEGTRPYFSLLTEYRPNRVVGGMLNVAYDNRGGKFKTVMAPCNCPADLSTNLTYVSVEPSLRIAPFSSAFYVFAGPTISFNVANSFTYKQEKQTDVTADWGNTRKTVLSAQAGAGIDIPVSRPSSRTQMTISPFASFQTNYGHNPRSTESWSLYTVRGGIALKFGTAKRTAAATPEPYTGMITPGREVQFAVRAPKAVAASRQVKETFPLRNSVFFNVGSAEIPARYRLLNHNQAAAFRESQLQQSQPDNLNNGRSSRQLAVYYNILNIIGDRLRTSPQSSIALVGASDKNPAEGKQMAENIRQYLITVFDINGSRITTEGRDKPVIPSEQPGATRDLALLREGDRRVDIVSTSPELLLQVGGSTSSYFRPVQIMAVTDDLDSHVLFDVAGATELLNSWSVQLTDNQGRMQTYGPYIGEQASVAGSRILGAAVQNNYKVVMTGQAKAGGTVRKESSVNLVKVADAKTEGLRYSILFDFDKSKSIDSYETFLSDVVAPLIPANSTVIVHGYTDIIGETAYNQNLSQERAAGTQKVLESALAKAGKRGTKFQTTGFGEDENMSPFENNFPEKRFYNRTVIIDILPSGN